MCDIGGECRGDVEWGGGVWGERVQLSLDVCLVSHLFSSSTSTSATSFFASSPQNDVHSVSAVVGRRKTSSKFNRIKFYEIFNFLILDFDVLFNFGGKPKNCFVIPLHLKDREFNYESRI